MCGECIPQNICPGTNDGEYFLTDGKFLAIPPSSWKCTGGITEIALSYRKPVDRDSFGNGQNFCDYVAISTQLPVSPSVDARVRLRIGWTVIESFTYLAQEHKPGLN